MTVYEYPEYEADAALVQQWYERIDRAKTRLEQLSAEWANIHVEAQGADGDVVLSVNHKGQLTSFSLAEGCTLRYTHLGLEELINTTLREAVKAAADEATAVTDAANASAAAALRLDDAWPTT